MVLSTSIILFAWIGFIGHFYFFDNFDKASRLGFRKVSTANTKLFPLYHGRIFGVDSVCVFLKDGEIFGTIVCAFLLIVVLVIEWIAKPDAGTLGMITAILSSVVVLISCFVEGTICKKVSAINENWKNGCYGEGAMEKHSKKALRAARETYATAEIVKVSSESFFDKSEVWYVVIQTEDGQTSKHRICERLDYRYAEHPSIRLL